jgi:sterol desaturase/sphingolipid hydroxylase (fatty acid hydroxylase superfamily)
MNSMALPLLGMAACVLLELYFTRAKRGTAIPWRDVVLNLNSGHLLMWLFRGMEIAAFAWILAQANLHWLDHWHPATVWIFALFAWDLGFYWMHRLHHTFGALWSVHVVHHEGEHFNLSLAIRNSWYSSLTTLPFTAAPLALAGVPLEVFVAVSTLHYAVQFYNHNGIVDRSGLLERLLVTPAHHRVHHGQNHEYRDRNFGGTFLIWDKLFRTFQHELPGVPIRYGISSPTLSTNPFWVNTVPMLRYARLRVPRFTAARRVHVPEGVIGAGGLLLFVIAAYYIHREGTWSGLGQPAFFTLIVAATVALGGMSDGRTWWGIASWIVIAVVSLIALPLYFGIRDTTGLVLLGAFLVHGVAAVAVAMRRPAMEHSSPKFDKNA